MNGVPLYSSVIFNLWTYGSCYGPNASVEKGSAPSVQISGKSIFASNVAEAVIIIQDYLVIPIYGDPNEYPWCITSVEIGGEASFINNVRTASHLRLTSHAVLSFKRQ